MPHLMCALGIFLGTAAIHWPSISQWSGRTATKIAHSIEESQTRIEAAILAPQASSIDLLIVAIAEEAIEEIRFAAPDRWRENGEQTALSEAELAVVRARLSQVAAAGHATALGQFEIVLRPAEQLGLSTHRAVKIARTTAAGKVDVREAFVSLLPSLKLTQLNLFDQQLILTVNFSVTDRTNTETFANSSIRMERLQVRAGESLLVIAKNPLPIEQRATEQKGAETRSLDHQHRLLLITPGRELRPKSTGQIARDRGIPQLVK